MDETTETQPQPCNCGLPHVDGYRVPGTGATCPFYPWSATYVEGELSRRRREGRTITIDLDTGDWLNGARLQGNEDGVRVAASVLPGWPAEEIAKAYAAWMNADEGQVSALEAETLPSEIHTKAQLELRWPAGTSGSDRDGDMVTYDPEYTHPAAGWHWKYRTGRARGADASVFLPITNLSIPATPAAPAPEEF